MHPNSILIAGLARTLLAGCGGEAPPQTEDSAGVAPPAPMEPALEPVTEERLLAAANEEWLAHGRTWDEQRFSPLDAINPETVTNLGLAWHFDVPTRRGMEATPIVADGRMYVTGSWSIVYALDAATGELLWTYDPEVERAWAQYLCCDVVNRGVALWGDKVYVGTLDGYLVALDATSGEVAWKVDTIDRKPPYSITGAPRVAKELVFIGNGGADFGVRGYVSAYDAATGELRWRFHTVPGNPADGFENELLAQAAETWTGEWWRYGGGGTVWDSMAFDPELDLLYFGVGNGSPWNQQIRSPEGGDNLFLASIVAVRPDTGEYVWHYQTTPGETWDYTATQHMILADLEIDGATRKVLMQAPKNGFFYVLDRTNGEFISAEALIPVTWAQGVDQETGRPIETPGSRYTEGPFMNMPSGFGAHNWHPMAMDPTRGLVYVPVQEVPGLYLTDLGFEYTEGFWNPGIEFEALHVPDDPAIKAQVYGQLRGSLLAWDPVTQQEVWRYQHAGPWNGGVLATAGDLVFQGSILGEFAAYRADSGERLWQFDAQTGIVAAPISYAIEGEQHVAVAAGWGTVMGMLGGEPAEAMGLGNISRILAFRLGGNDALPPKPAGEPTPMPEPPALAAEAVQVASGKDLYYERCVMCHGINVVSGGVLPDLRYASDLTHATWDGIVLGGLRRDKGMPAFSGILTPEDSAAIQAFVVSEARKAYALRTAAP